VGILELLEQDVVLLAVLLLERRVVRREPRQLLLA